ncbi:High choriolytic enzyme 1 [Merluccius polli]|uniref:Metalloendopeptidase n=1 Tax=Merluccius polli TaxID=89951 RepID=A0AA47NCU9_MERPO|nr:High choriolytic enzyme 1 [Merluccius polli]
MPPMGARGSGGATWWGLDYIGAPESLWGTWKGREECSPCLKAFHVGTWKGKEFPEQSHTAKCNILQIRKGELDGARESRASSVLDPGGPGPVHTGSRGAGAGPAASLYLACWTREDRDRYTRVPAEPELGPRRHCTMEQVEKLSSEWERILMAQRYAMQRKATLSCPVEQDVGNRKAEEDDNEVDDAEDNAEPPDASDAIETANARLGNMRGGRSVQFGDIIQPLTSRNASPCTARGCKWPKHKDGYVYVPVAFSSKYSKSRSSKSSKCVNSEIFYMGIQSMKLLASSRSHLSVCLKAEPNYGSSFEACRSSTQSPVFALFIGGVNGTTSISNLPQGRQGGRQFISLQKGGCVYKTVIQHEVLHALGFHHEQSRSDRDKFVNILYNNILPGKKHNFDKVATNNLGTPYDYNSIMHYGRYAFSKSRGVLPTIVPIPDSTVVIGKATKMSTNDIRRVNQLYQCWCEWDMNHKGAEIDG